MLNGRLLFSTSISNSDTNQNDATAAPKLGKTKVPPQNQVADTKILRTLVSCLWMRENPEFRLRVLIALAFLVGAKVCPSAITIHCCSTPFPSFFHWVFFFFSDFEHSSSLPLQACCRLAYNRNRKCYCSRFLYYRQFKGFSPICHASCCFDWIWDSSLGCFCFQRYYHMM